ncbi:MAG: hypothetical protein SGJ20_11840 [Planctomycetota bacterium]|nr:hypothetical protein [Planctomycetota bacterium]
MNPTLQYVSNVAWRISTGRRFLLAATALACFACHAGWHLLYGQPVNLLWACHTAALCVGIGLLFAWPMPIAVGGLLLMVGLPSWILSLIYTGDFAPTSILTHVGGLLCAVLGLRATTYPKNAPMWALALMGLLLLVSRALSTPVENVNVAYTASAFPYDFSHRPELHMFMVLLVWAVFLLMADPVLRWLAECSFTFHWPRRQTSSAVEC